MYREEWITESPSIIAFHCRIRLPVTTQNVRYAVKNRDIHNTEGINAIKKIAKGPKICLAYELLADPFQ